jgi:TRAP transporter 4TM/12TM fusion protein
MTDTRGFFPTKLLHHVLIGLALVVVAYHALSSWTTLHNAMEHYTTHLGLILLVVALDWAHRSSGLYEGGKRVARLLFVAAVVVSFGVACGYLYIFAEDLEISQPFLERHEFVIGFLLLIPVILLTWVVWGWVLALICACGALYFWLGHLMPEAVAGIKFRDFEVMSDIAGMGGPRGMYKYIPLSADTIFLLIVYGGLLAGTRVIDMFAEFGKAIGRLFRGGIGYSAIVASSLIGMVTGQAVANIVLSGSMTIPTMKRRGFTGEQAGAIECLASNGSQFLPPIMGLGAFLMAVILGIGYIEVVTAAILPAALYVGIVGVGLYAMIQASPSIPYDVEEVDWNRIWWTLPSFLISFGALIALLYQHFSGGKAGFWGIALLLAMAFLRPRRYQPTLKQVLDGLLQGVTATTKLALILVAIGIIVQMLITTGLGNRLGRVMIETSGDSLGIGLIIGMIISLFIGMGLPTPAAYSLIAIVVIPSLIDLGMPPLAAHFFGFYFAVYSSLTPPVAVGVLTAVRISGAGFLSTARECLRLGGVGLLLPFMFVAFPNVLGFPNFEAETLVASGLVLLCSYMLGVSLYGSFRGRLTTVERLFLLIGPAAFLTYLVLRDPWIAAIPPLTFAIFIAYRRKKTRDWLRRPVGSDSIHQLDSEPAQERAD